MILFAATIRAQIADQLFQNTFRLAKANPVGIGAGGLRQRMGKRPTHGDRLAAHFGIGDTLPIIFPLRHHHAQENNICPLPVGRRLFSDVAID